MSPLNQILSPSVWTGVIWSVLLGGILFIGACKSDPCRAADVCRQTGSCTTRRINGVDHCVVTTDEDCARSEDCKREGRCSWAGHAVPEACRAASRSHCQSSTVCRTQNRCVEQHGECVMPEAVRR